MNDILDNHPAVANQKQKVTSTRTEVVIKKTRLSKTNKAIKIIIIFVKVDIIISKLNRMTFEKKFTLFNNTFAALALPNNCNFK